MPYGLCHVPEDSKEAGVCSSHSFLDELVLPLDDERWVDFWPPNRFDCGCSVEVVDRANAAKNGLRPTPWEDVPDKHDIPDRDFRNGFTAVEHPSLPYADHLAGLLKSKCVELSLTRRHNLAVGWHCDEKLGKALEKRFQDGLEVFARQEEGKVSCGEMSINIDVFPRRYPSGLTGQVATVTDSGYQSVYRDLAVKLDRKQSDRELPATGKKMSEGELERLARMIMKKMPQGLRTGDINYATEAGFEICVLHGMITLGFEKRESDDRLFYLLKEVAEIRKPPQEIKGWFDERLGKGEVTVERPV